MSIYADIKAKINAAQPMKVKYRGGVGGGFRKMWPMVIGTSPNPNTNQPEQVVLCYQFEGPRNARGWRCLKVNSINSAIEDTNGTNRPVLDAADLARQSCVVTREVPPP